MTGIDLQAENWLIKNSYGIEALLEDEYEGDNFRQAIIEAYKAGYLKCLENEFEDNLEMNHKHKYVTIKAKINTIDTSLPKISLD
jgi:hypothetical protein